MERTGMVREDTFELVSVTDPRISPDGSLVAFTLAGVDQERNLPSMRVWMARSDGSEAARQFTSGDIDHLPRWSPDGRSLAFAGHREALGSQLFIVPALGGEAERIVSVKEEIEEIVWAPDGKRLYFVSREPSEERYGKPDKDQPPRRIRRLVYRQDGIGFTVDRPRQIFSVDSAGVEPVQLTHGEFEIGSFSLSPDGSTIAFTSSRHEDWDLNPGGDIFLIPAEGGEPKAITKERNGYVFISWSPQGDQISFVAVAANDAPRHAQVGSMSTDGVGARLLSEDLDRTCLPLPPVREPIWDGDDLLFTIEDAGNNHVYRVPADGSGKPEPVIGGTRQVVGLDAASGMLAFVATDAIQTPDLFVLRNGEETRLTHFAQEFLERRLLLEAQRFEATSYDGSEVEAWIVPPLMLEEGKKYPTLLHIHGGPTYQFGNRFTADNHILSSAGYAVVYCNPRGSSGYSESWARAIRGASADPDPGSGLGDGPFQDLMAVVDEAIRKFEFVDDERLGVFGGSYGGFMTVWSVGHTERFKAASCDRSSINLATISWRGDGAAAYMKALLGKTLLEDPAEYIANSPIHAVEDIHTPLQILHNENDVLCPIEQSEQLFMFLRLLGRDVEFVRFPGASHTVDFPKHRVERLGILIDWFDRYLKEASSDENAN